MKKEMLMAFEAYRNSRTPEEKARDYARYLETEKECNSNECISFYVGENEFQTDSMSFIISHDDLHLLGDPTLLYFDYMYDGKTLVLFPVWNVREANTILTPRYYKEVINAKHSTGISGEYLVISQEFSSELRELGWEIGETYRVPCYMSVQKIDGLIRPILYYCLRDGYKADCGDPELAN